MTRASLNRKLRLTYFVLFAVLAMSLSLKLASHVPVLAGTRFSEVLADIYAVIKDMSFVLITVIAAYLANVFQKRSNFVRSLEREWRRIVRTKSALHSFCEKDDADIDDYMKAFCTISETLDNMRIVYKNAGETNKLIGLYPYEPLHDMRRALMSLDPRRFPDQCKGHRKRVRDAILQSFYALRENFLEELDLEQPAHPLLVSGGRRLKRGGASKWAVRRQNRQRYAQNGAEKGREDVSALLAKLKQEEEGGRPAGGNGNGAPTNVSVLSGTGAR